MYLPSAFAESDLTALDRLLERDSFITLVTTRDGTPTVSHLPVLYSRIGDQIQLTGHWARPNPQANHDGAAMAIVHGPHAYVSPGWYPDKEAKARVPTWNYVVAHLHGRLIRFQDTAALSDLVGAMSDHYEASVGGHWKFEPDRDDHRNQLAGIVGFRLIVERVQMSFKLNQNHPPANRAAVASQMDAQGSDRSRAVAALMREHMD